MWHSAIALALIPCLNPPQVVAVQAPISELAAPTSPTSYRAYTSYKQIRPGSNEKVAVSFTLNPGTFISHRAKGEDIVPMRLEVKGDTGLSISGFDYPMGYDRSFQFRRGTLNVVGERISVQFKLNVARDTKPGKYAVHGRLIFQQIGDRGFGPLEQVEVEIPVEVGWQSEMNSAKEWPFSEQLKKSTSDNRAKWTLVALAPILLPLAFIASIVCLISGEDCRC